MAVGQVAEAPRPLGDLVAEPPLWRLNLMRIGCAVLGVGAAVVRWPASVVGTREE